MITGTLDNCSGLDAPVLDHAKWTHVATRTRRELVLSRPAPRISDIIEQGKGFALGASHMADAASLGVKRERFEEMYAGQAPWETGRPQQAFVEAADRITGSILDVGCGPGDNALFFASRGNAVTGADFLESPIARAQRKAAESGISATFVLKDALQLSDWSERFDNVLDSGLFHVFSDEDRVRYVEGLETVLKPAGHLFLLCFSDAMPGTQGPRRVSQHELRTAFSKGWQIESIEPAVFDVRPEAKAGLFDGINPKAWFMIARRSA